MFCDTTSEDNRAGAVRTLILLFLCIIAAGCADDAPDPIERDRDAIMARDTIVALVTYNSTGYFLYRGEPMGYEYDLLRRLAAHDSVFLITKLVRDRSELLRMLNEGEGDIVAARLIESEIDTAAARHTRALYTTRPMLVQQTAAAPDVPAPVEELLPGDSVIPGTRDRGAGTSPGAVRGRLIQSRSQLAGREVHAGAGSAFVDRLVELSDSLTGDIRVIELDSATDEAVIRGVASGEYRLGVAPENVAELTQEYYSNIEVVPTLGDPVSVVWAVRKNAPRLKAALDTWLEQQDEAGVLDELYQKYFVDRSGYREREQSEYLTSTTGRLSEFDDLLRSGAATIDWDWRLLASQAYQESKFDANARSWAGAMGLLQLMPGTAREVGVSRPFDPEQNVGGAVRYLEKLDQQWQDEITDPAERLRFVLASYNTGRGHVLDAQRLAEKHGDDPKRWEDTAYWLLRKSERVYYTDPVVRHGFSRGLEPVTYVAIILERFDHYREFVVDPAGTTAADSVSDSGSDR